MKINKSYNNDSQEEWFRHQRKSKGSIQHSGNIPRRWARMKVMPNEKCVGALSGRGWGGGWKPEIKHYSQTSSFSPPRLPYPCDRYHMTTREPAHYMGFCGAPIFVCLEYLCTGQNPDVSAIQPSPAYLKRICGAVHLLRDSKIERAPPHTHAQIDLQRHRHTDRHRPRDRPADTHTEMDSDEQRYTEA